jgi:hypothetical protein
MKTDNPNWKQLMAFKDAWDETLAGMEKEPEDTILEAIFKQQVRHCSCLSHDIGIYDRAEKGTPNRSYRFLYESVERFLTRKQSELNRSDIQRSKRDHDRGRENDRGRTRERSATPAPSKDKTKGKKGKKTKTRDKSRNRDSSTESNSSGKRINSKSKPGICYTWKNTGKCAKLDKGECGYNHPDNLRGSSSGSSSSSRSSSKSGKKGKGRKGGGKGKKGKRSESPKNKKGITCYFFLRAKCNKGENCDFGHDENELKKFQEKNKGDFQ